TDGAILRVPLQGGAPEVVVPNQPGASGIAVDGTDVYWVLSGTFESNFTDGSVLRAPKSGGPSTVLASEQRGPVSIVLDMTSVYWTNTGSTSGNDGAVMKTEK